MKILITTDFSEDSEQALEYVKTFSKELRVDPEICILHCIEHISDSRFYHGLGIDVENIILNCEEESEKQMKEIIDKHFSDYKNVASEIKHSAKSVQAEIVKFAEDKKFDLLLISRKGHTALKHVFFGSISEYVIRHINCPVLVVPE